MPDNFGPEIWEATKTLRPNLDKMKKRINQVAIDIRWVWVLEDHVKAFMSLHQEYALCVLDELHQQSRPLHLLKCTQTDGPSDDASLARRTHCQTHCRFCRKVRVERVGDSGNW